MFIPPWVSWLLAIAVIAYGLFRIKLFFTPKEEYERRANRGAMYRVPRRLHLMMGLVFLAFGGWLILSAMGVQIGAN